MSANVFDNFADLCSLRICRRTWHWIQWMQISSLFFTDGWTLGFICKLGEWDSLQRWRSEPFYHLHNCITLAEWVRLRLVAACGYLWTWLTLIEGWGQIRHQELSGEPKKPSFQWLFAPRSQEGHSCLVLAKLATAKTTTGLSYASKSLA